VRELWVIGGCILGLFLLLALLGQTFNTAARTPTHAIEVTQLQADLEAAKGEANNARAEVERLKRQLQEAQRMNEELKVRVAELEKTTAVAK
jgi:chromosome segregation ATPase